MKKFDLEDRPVEFPVIVIRIVEKLPETRVCIHLGNQLLRSVTSTALNYGEAQDAESKKDFIHKMKVILKELRETRISLKVLTRLSLIDDAFTIQENNELVAIFTASIRTARGKITSKAS